MFAEPQGLPRPLIKPRESILDLLPKKKHAHIWLWPWQRVKRCAICGGFNMMQVGENTISTTDSFIEMQTTAAPANATAGTQRVYLDSGDLNKMKRKDSAGVVTTIEGGGAAGGMVLIEKKVITSNSQTASFAGLTGETDEVYVLDVDFINNAGALVDYELRPNGTAPGANDDGARLTIDPVGGPTATDTAAQIVARLNTSGRGAARAHFFARRVANAINRRRFVFAIQARENAGDVLGDVWTSEWDETATNVSSIDIRATSASGIGNGSTLALYRMVQS